MRLRTDRKNYLLPITVALYLLTLLMLLSELDRQYFQVEKESIIKYSFRELFPHNTAHLQELSRTILLQHRPDLPVDAPLEQAWRQVSRGMLDGDGCVFRIRIVPKDASELVVEEDAAKFDRLNGFANTLFYRNFENVVSYEIAGEAGQPWVGLLSFHYTTPEHYGPITALTKRYRIWALLMLVAVTAAYGFMWRRLILPVRHVVSRIDAAAGMPPRLMTTPASMLEKAYNTLARDAILLRVGHSLREVISAQPTSDRATLLARIPGPVRELMDYRAVLLLELAPSEDGAFTVSRCVQAADGSDSVDYEAVCRMHIPLPKHVAAIDGGAPLMVEEAGECVVCDISLPEDRPHLTCLALFAREKGRPDAAQRAWHLETAALLAEQLRETVAVFDVTRRHVRGERSRANINLARNLGHDLTNIIATSKLDILTVSKILGDGASGVDVDSRRELLGDSVQGLLNSARLLQDVVNIYRSFSYINRPSYETVHINALLDEIIGVFALSLPAKTVLHKQYAEALPACSVEPRLLKLAVFNVMTNAADAMKRHGEAEGTITVTTTTDPAGEGVSIAVRDTGPGICTAEGRAASQAEIDGIFRYGVSTKTEDSGEGLGLSWVWTIVEEFHGGKVTARNHPDGGAEFVMRIGVTDEHRSNDDHSDC
ncbi:MAG: HAMP domain-containing histidine kinase [Verrucomicrobia bacterium]|jgi:signal transduction histidine kinase|nr:HAMP domain-containing histidine kinase [Verrucomicrobiota bacterium]MBT7068438.1 HAMP domain-containing histidine kinase [Verrucomicrobiota bacterium]MBT7698994.1 HAMP domain-containing histidine kinase [Verrucomicrobiota bacterium]